MGLTNPPARELSELARHGLFLWRRNADLHRDNSHYADCQSIQGVGWDAWGLVLFILHFYSVASLIAGVQWRS